MAKAMAVVLIKAIKGGITSTHVARKEYESRTFSSNCLLITKKEKESTEAWHAYVGTKCDSGRNTYLANYRRGSS
jgi:hypothetical protein